MSKMNSRWRKGAERYSAKRTVEDRRLVGDRYENDAPAEVRFIERKHSPAGWRNGARITKRNP